MIEENRVRPTHLTNMIWKGDGPSAKSRNGQQKEVLHGTGIFVQNDLGGLFDTDASFRTFGTG